MKKIAQLILFCLLLSKYTANAQHGIHLGFQVSPQMSWLINKDDLNNVQFEYKNTFNSSVGLLFQYEFPNEMGLALNPMYSFEGQRYTYGGIEYIRQVDYIKIPFLYFFSYKAGKNIKFIGKVGPQLNILTNASLAFKNGTDLVPDQSAAYENYEVGGTAYAGAGIRMSDTWYLDILLRYDFSFTNAESKAYNYNINQPVPVGGSGVSTAKDPLRPTTITSTAGLNIGVRYIFPIAKTGGAIVK